MRSMRLSSLIAKEIRLKHLNEGIMHMQSRKKYRNYKLREHYQTPIPSAHQLILYSNIHGNQFIFNQQHFDSASFPDPSEAYFQIMELQKQINEATYKLWLQSKSYADKTYFPVHRQLLLWSMGGIWLLCLLLCVLDKFLAGRDHEGVVEWSIITIILTVVAVNIGFMLGTLRAKYRNFEYDNEIVRVVSELLVEAEERVDRCGLEVRCDREMTWICFRVKESSSGLMREESIRENTEQDHY